MMEQISAQWAIGLAIAFPLLLLLLQELIVRANRNGSIFATTLSGLRNFLLPALGLAVMVRFVLGLQEGQTVDLVTQTLFWTVLLYVALGFMNDVVFGAAQAGTWRANVPDLLRDIVRFGLVGIGAAFIYSQIWGKELAGALTALGVGSLVIGLALQEPLGNVFSGIMLLFERPLNTGDWIKVDSHVGRVVSMNWRAVNMETITREMVVVPNSSLYKTSFVNLSRPTPLRTEMLELSFGYEHPPNQIKHVLLELLHDTPGVLSDPPPVVRTQDFADFAIKYSVMFSVKDQSVYHVVRDEVMTRLWYAVQRAKLNVPYPIAMEIGEDARELEARRTLNPHALLAPFPRFQVPAEAALEVAHFSAGETILKLGDGQDGLRVVVSGEALLLAQSLDGAEQEIGRLGPGDFYGEHSLLAGQASPAAIRAFSDTLVVLFELETSRKLVADSPTLAREIGETIDQRRRALQAARKAKSARAGA